LTLAVVATVGSKPLPAPRGRVDRPEDPGPLTAIIWIPVDSPSSLPDLGFAEQAWLVDERPQWDGAGPCDAGAVVPGVKQVTFVRRLPTIDRAEFARHWTDVHAPLARLHHPALWRYQQNVVVRPLLPEMDDDVDGIAELGMRLRLDFSERMYDSPEGRRTIGADVRKFIDLRTSWQVVTREYPLSSLS
jgi:uncharacterized protein (TIGR02118 family)